MAIEPQKKKNKQTNKQKRKLNFVLLIVTLKPNAE